MKNDKEKFCFADSWNHRRCSVCAGDVYGADYGVERFYAGNRCGMHYAIENRIDLNQAGAVLYLVSSIFSEYNAGIG